MIEHRNHSIVLKHYKENLKWFNLNHEILKRRYLNQYVAVNDKKIVESDRVLDELVDRLNSNHHDVWYRFAIEFVGEEGHASFMSNRDLQTGQ